MGLPASLSASLSTVCICPITHELMVDPVLAEDEHTYERSAIEMWLGTHCTSPMVPSRALSASRLVSNRIVRETTEALVAAGVVEGPLAAAWRERHRAVELDRARELYREGRVMDAAKLGLPAACSDVAWEFFQGAAPPPPLC